MPTQYNIQLRNGDRVFSTLSNHPDADIFGPKKKRWSRVVFLIHGFPDDNSSWSEVWDILLEELTKVDKAPLLLAPLLRGYEPSSQGPKPEYRAGDFASDYQAFIQSVAPRGTPVHLLGHDWGAIATFKAASLFPDLITSVTTLAIPYLANIPPLELAWKVPEQLYLSSYFITMHFPWLYRPRLAQPENPEYLRGLWKYWSPGWDFKEEDLAHVNKTLNQPGVIDSATAYYRSVRTPGKIGDFEKWVVDFEKVPTLILGGNDDQCMSRKLYLLEQQKLKDVPNVKVQLLSKVGHFLHREDPRKVAELAAQWFLKYT